MRILIAGGSGLIGKALIKEGLKQGHKFRLLTRSRTSPLPVDLSFDVDVSQWDPEKGEIDDTVFNDVDAVINLAGENIAGGRWTKNRKKALMDSRVNPTRLLVSRIKERENKPQVFLSASAIGYYRPVDKGHINEDGDPGKLFISEICKAWEREADMPESFAIRTVKARIGIVLSKDGGALEKMLLPFSLGLGGKLGSGKQYMSWISIEDVTNAILYCLSNKKISGPVNFTSPSPVTNLQFTKTLGKVLSRPTILPVPPFALRLLLGEMADQLLLSSLPVIPEKLLLNRFEFKGKDLEEVLKIELEN